MAGITQTIPNFVGGMSEQPDNLKFPGQVKEIVNGVPDITRGLFKRPGSERIGLNALSSVVSGGSWFHYFRDESEGAYIGQIENNGTVRIWSCKTGVLQTTAYGSGASGTTEKAYLATNTPENLQFLTINDTTFVTNRDTTNAATAVGHTGTTDATPDAHFGFIELLRTENGRQYGVNINNGATVTTLTRATRIKIQSDTVDESDGTGHCPGIGTQVFSVTAASSYTDSSIVSANAPKKSTGLVPDTQIGFGATAIIHYGDLVGTGLATGTPVVYTATNTSQQIGNLTSELHTL